MLSKQFTQKQSWVVVNEEFFFPEILAKSSIKDWCDQVRKCLCKPREISATVACDVLEYIPIHDIDDVQTVEPLEGYGARLVGDIGDSFDTTTPWKAFTKLKDAEEYGRVLFETFLLKAEEEEEEEPFWHCPHEWLEWKMEQSSDFANLELLLKLIDKLDGSVIWEMCREEMKKDGYLEQENVSSQQMVRLNLNRRSYEEKVGTS